MRALHGRLALAIRSARWWRIRNLVGPRLLPFADSVAPTRGGMDVIVGTPPSGFTPVGRRRDDRSDSLGAAVADSYGRGVRLLPFAESVAPPTRGGMVVIVRTPPSGFMPVGR